MDSVPCATLAKADHNLSSTIATAGKKSKLLLIRKERMTRCVQNTPQTFNEEVIFMHSSYAESLHQNRRFTEATQVLENTTSSLVSSRSVLPTSESLKLNRTLGVLYRMNSMNYECLGDFKTALRLYQDALRVQQSEPTLTDLLKLTELYLLLGPTYESPLRSLRSFLLKKGNWVTIEQLPEQFVKGLTSRPWHDGPHPAWLQQVIERIESKHSVLVKEFMALNVSGLLTDEHECIHEIQHGTYWKRYEVTAEWNDLNSTTRCSTKTPHACELWSELLTIDSQHFRPLRLGYSAIGPHTHLRQHFGMTNAQLKFHMGLIVPGGNNTATRCARFRVGSTTRGWSEGRVMMFDDSYNHEVWNDCDVERSVLQVVFVHPDVMSRRDRSKLLTKEVTSGDHNH
eukprot:PhF_6_TR14212/c0_g1_i1/m.22787/K00476/ASPH; aspartate beta-hydroxylase